MSLNVSDEICRSQLYPKSVLSIVKYNYSIQFDSCYLIQSREHDVYLLSSPNKKAIFKIYAYSRISEDKILKINELSTITCSKVMVFETNTNKTFIKMNFPEGHRFGVLLNYIKGKEIDCREREQAIAYGIALARIHQKKGNFSSYHFDDYGLQEIILNAQLSKETISNLLDIVEYCNDYSSNDFSLLETGICHGDCHGGNAIYSNGIARFIDFDFANIGPIVGDLSILIWVKIGGLGLDNIQIENILEGYSSERDIPSCSEEDFYFFLLKKELNSLVGHINRQKTAGIAHINDQFILKRLHSFRSKLIKKHSESVIFVRY